MLNLQFNHQPFRRLQVHVSKVVLASVCGLMMFAGDNVYAARESEPFAYIANREAPAKVIKSIAETFGMAVVLTDLPNEKVSGKFSGNSLAEVLNELARNYSFDWFIHGGTLYLYKSSDWATERITVGQRGDDIKESLATYGLNNAKFKVLEQPERESIIVTGPAAYIKLIKNAFQFAPGPNDADIMVFKLKYASVEDRVITLREKTVTTPGVATVLTNILTGGRPSPSATQPSKTVLPGMPVPMPGLATQPDALSAYSPQDPSASSGGGRNNADSSDNSSRKGNNPFVKVQSDPRTNSIIIRDRSSKYAQYRALIDQLDIPLAMVEIEAVMIDIDQRKLDELGTEFGLTVGKVSFDFNGASFSTANGARSGSGGASNNNTSAYTVTENNIANLAHGSSSSNGSTAIVTDRGKFSARVQALVATNDAKVLAKPTILTLDNLSAVIDLTQTFYTRVSGERVANVVPVTAGSLLRVSPRIVTSEQGREIQLQVDIEDGNLQDRAGIDLPTVQKSSISTQASIRENQAILIGGYNRESEQNFGAKVPLLGDIPFLGRLMQTRSSTSQKVTRLFLITPRIVSVDPLQSLPAANYGIAHQKAIALEKKSEGEK